MAGIMTEVTFETELRGYRRDQVDRVIARLNDEVSALNERLADVEVRAHSTSDPISVLDDRLVGVLRAAEEAAAARRTDAERSAEAILHEAEETLAAARKAGEERVASAKANAEAILRDAEHQAAELRKQASIERDQAAHDAAAIRRSAKDEGSAIVAKATAEAQAILAGATERERELKAIEQDALRRIGDAAGLLHLLQEKLAGN